MNKRNGSHDPAVNVYISSWIQDESAGCCPTWRNLYIIFREIGLEKLAREFREILLECKCCINCYYMYNVMYLSYLFTDTICIAMDRRKEELIDLQRQLTSLKVECEKLQTDTGKEILQPAIEHCLSESLSVVWVLKKKKREILEVSIQNKDLQTQLQSIQETQKKSMFVGLFVLLCISF